MLRFLAEYRRPEYKVRAPDRLIGIRRQYYERPLTNLVYLFKKRYAWMNRHIPVDAPKPVELGCGLGLSRDFIRNKNVVLTDVLSHPWVDQHADALEMPFEDASVDALILNNVLHHLPFPQKFFREASRVLKPGGKILIQDMYASILMRVILRAMRHEEFSFLQNPYDETKPCTDPSEPWSANCALSKLIFDDVERFEKNNPSLRVVSRHPSEFIMFPLSGGVVTKTPTIPLPMAVLSIIDFFDELLVRLAPRLLALQVRVVVQKV